MPMRSKERQRGEKLPAGAFDAKTQKRKTMPKAENLPITGGRQQLDGYVLAPSGCGAAMQAARLFQSKTQGGGMEERERASHIQPGKTNHGHQPPEAPLRRRSPRRGKAEKV